MVAKADYAINIQYVAASFATTKPALTDMTAHNFTIKWTDATPMSISLDVECRIWSDLEQSSSWTATCRFL